MFNRRNLCAWFGACLLLPVVALGTHAKAEDKAPQIEFKHGNLALVAAAPSPGCVRIKIFSAMNKGVEVLEVENPPRLVLVIEGVSIPLPKKVSVQGLPFVSAIRLGRHDSRTRVVLDLTGAARPPYKKEESRGSIVVDIGAECGLRVTPAAPEPARQAAPTAKVSTPAVTPGVTASATNTPVPSMTPTATNTVTPTVTSARTATATRSQTPTVRSAPTNTAAPSASYTPTQTAVASLPPKAPGAIITVAKTAPPPMRTAAGTASAAKTEIKQGELGEPREKTAIGAAGKAAESVFALDKVYVKLRASDRPITNLSIKNVTDRTIYFSSRALALVSPGTRDEKREVTNALLISPKRFALEPGAERTIRLVTTLRPGELEQAFRLEFLPSRDPPAEQATARETVTLAGPAVLVLIEPFKPVATLTWRREDNGVEFINDGNVALSIDSPKVCSRKIEKVCESKTGRLLFPGNRWFFPLRPEQSLEFLRGRLGDYQAILIAALNQETGKE